MTSCKSVKISKILQYRIIKIHNIKLFHIVNKAYVYDSSKESSLVHELLLN